MEEVTKFILELYQFLFISSILFIIYIISIFFIKLYGRVKENKETKLVLTKFEKISFWVALSLILSYLI